MQPAVLRLECFDRRAPSPPPARFAQADLDAAHARGLAEGAAAADAAARRDLAAQVAELARTLGDAAASRAAMTAGVMEQLSPVLDAFADGALPVLARARMQAAVMAELRRLADESVAPVTVRLRCGPDQQADLRQAIEQAGCAAPTLDPTGSDGTVEIVSGDARITFDEAATAQAFRDLFRDFMDGASE